ncbi:MAG: RDD family protein [Candidatus Dormibacteraeota bacterium]|nr:RDD family protein [Candidatus Dormibacteraeota bacterium]
MAGALAGFWRRLLAVIIDGIILGVVVQIINGIIAAASGGMINDGAGYTRGTLFELVLGILYFGYMWSQYGKTLGYMALGIRLVREDGAPVSFVLGAGRWVMIWLSFQLCVIPAIVSAFMIGFGQQKKAIHDYIVGTLVVHG